MLDIKQKLFAISLLQGSIVLHFIVSYIIPRIKRATPIILTYIYLLASTLGNFVYLHNRLYKVSQRGRKSIYNFLCFTANKKVLF